MFERLRSYLQRDNLLWLSCAVLFLYWAAPVLTPTFRYIALENKDRRDYIDKIGYDKFREQNRKMTQYVSAVYQEAKAAGDNYSPEMYFRHRRQIDDAKAKLGCLEYQPETNYMFGEMNHLSFNNLIRFGGSGRYGGRARFTEKDLATARTKYGYDIAPSPPINWASVWRTAWTGTLRFAFWLVWLYFFTMPFLAVKYLTTMASTRGKGIFRTIASEPKKYLLAVIFWPRYFFDYPTEMFIRIKTEAELRREFGWIWKPLSREDKQTVDEVVRSGRYQQWAARRRATVQYKRGLASALSVTLIVMLLLPVFTLVSTRANAQKTGLGRGSNQAVLIICSMHTRAGPIITLSPPSVDDTNSFVDTAPVMVPNLLSYIVVVKPIFAHVAIIGRSLWRALHVDHIPLSRPVVFTN